MPIITNVATPKITGPDEVWFDPRAGATAPSLIKGTEEGSANPQEFTLSYTEAPTPVPPGQEYKAGGTLYRNNAAIELYRSKTLSEDSKLAFCENQVRLGNAELKAGLKLYAKGLVDAARVDLTLALDMLETATRKKTDFSEDPPAPATLINVNNNAGSAKKENILVKAAELVTPDILPNRADTQVTASGTPLALTFKFSSSSNATAYTGDGTATVTPTDAKVKFYKTAECKPGEEANLKDGFAIKNGDLKDGRVTLYARSSDEDATGDVAVSLALAPNAKPLEVATAGPASVQMSLLPTNRVTPTITPTIAGSYDDTVWYPALAAGPQPLVKFGTDQSNPDVAFKGSGTVTRSNAKVALFYDEALTMPLSFVENKATIPNDVIVGKKPFYIKGLETGDTDLTFALVNACQAAILVQPAATTTLTTKQVTEVVPKIVWTSQDLPSIPASSPGTGTPVRVFLDQISNGGGNFRGTAKLTRSDKRLGVYDSNKRPVFSGSNLEATLPNETVMNPSNEYTAQWTGEDGPDSKPTLTLAATTPDEPYIVTQGSDAFLPEGDPQDPPIAIVTNNSVSPLIQTDFDLVLLSTTLMDGEVRDRTTPTRARFGCTQTKPSVGYVGEGTLTRDNDNVRVFFDEACTREMSFVGNKAVIPNADLLNADKRYFIVGAKAGKVALKLALSAPPVDATGINFSVTDPVEKKLAVIALTLEIYRSDGSQSPIAEAQMTDRAKRLTGRYVPLQNDQKQFGRAKLIIKQVTTDTWPSSADNHDVILALSSDKAELWNQAKDGAKVADKDAPLTLKKANLGSDKTYYLQSVGDVPSLALRDIQLELGLDRSDKDAADYPGAPDSIRPLENGDWLAATVVKITRVTPDAPDWRQYTNQPIDYSVTVNDNQNEAKTGQHTMITATTAPAVAGIGIDLMLWADPANAADIPNSTKSMTLTDHVPVVTDDTGKASGRLLISRFGGQKFTAVAFLADDAATGAATFGADATKAPDSYKSNPITVWRKMAYNVFAMNRHGTRRYGGNYSDMFDRGKLNTTFADSFLELDTAPVPTVVANVPALYDDGVGYPQQEYVAWLNARIQDGTIPPNTDRSFNLIFVENLALGTQTITQWFSKLELVNDRYFTIPLGNRAFDTQQSSHYLVPGSAQLSRRDGNFITNWTENIPDNNVWLTDTTGGAYNLVVDLNGVNRHGQNIHNLWIKVQLIDLKIFCGVSLGNQPSVFTACRFAEQRCARTNETVYSTTTHEVGHFLGLTPLYRPRQALTGNNLWFLGNGTDKTFYLDPATPPNVETYDQSIGQGSHCMQGFADFNDLKTNKHDSAKVQCLMYYSTVDPPVTDVCDRCKESVRGREYALSNTQATSNY